MSSNIFIPVHEAEFHIGNHSEEDEDCGPPELQRIRWAIQGSIILAAEYILPEDEYVDSNRRWVEFLEAEAVSVIQSRIHPNIISTPSSRAGIHRCESSNWMRTFRAGDIDGCAHYQVLFDGDVLDVICRGIQFGLGVFGEKA